MKSDYCSTLPRGWMWTNLREIAERINPGFPSGKHNKAKQGVPHLRPMNVNIRGEIDLSEVKYVQLEIYDPLLRGDVLFNNTNSPELLGKTAYIKSDTNWAYSNHMTRIKLNTSFLDPAWVSYSLHILFLSGFFKMNCTHHVNQASISSTFLAEKVFIHFPPLAEQHRIVAKIEEVLTKLDAGVEALKKAKAELRRYRQAVLKYAFEGRLTEEWRKANKGKIEPASVLLMRIKEEREKGTKGKSPRLSLRGSKMTEAILNDTIASPSVRNDDLSELPEGWVWTRLGEIISVKSGEGLTSYKMVPTGKYPVYGGNGITGYNNEFMFEDSKLIIGRVGAKCGVVHITQPKSWITDNALIVDFSYLDIKFLFYAIGHLNLNKYSVSTAQPVISGSKIYPLPFSLPSLPEQHKIVEEIERRFSVADEVEKVVEQSLKEAERLRQSILKRAFEGKLVSQDPSDEPAEKLLERIKAEKARLESGRKKSKMKFQNPGKGEVMA